MLRESDDDGEPMLSPPTTIGNNRRHSNQPPMSNGSCRSVDDLIEESIIAHDEKQRKLSRQYQALGAVLLALTSAVSLGVALVALSSRPNVDNANVEQNFHLGSSSGDELEGGDSSSGGGSSGSEGLDVQHSFSDLQQKQIEQYKAGRALMINVHITHHAGTTFCSEMKRWGPVPQFACMGGDNWHEHEEIAAWHKDRPWNATATAPRVDAVRQWFHMISWEFGNIPSPPLQETDWEYENILSVYITRNPIDRLLSGGGITNRKFGTLEERTVEQWWQYSKSTFTDNFALNRLTGGTCVDGENTSEECLAKGKELLNRFTIILDQNCLSEGITALARILGRPEPNHGRSSAYKVPKSATASANQRIHDDDVYEYLLRRNSMGIALYEWSKNISLVRCNDSDVNSDEDHDEGHGERR